MKKILTHYLGAILLYSVVFFGIIALNTRYKYLNQNEVKTEGNNYLVAIGD